MYIGAETRERTSCWMVHTLAYLSTPAVTILWMLCVPGWKSALYTGSRSCQDISGVVTFMSPVNKRESWGLFSQECGSKQTFFKIFNCFFLAFTQPQFFTIRKKFTENTYKLRFKQKMILYLKSLILIL